ncbi:MAG: HAMP domain-containing protein [FCB group bacterium]|nr:HAMP domain-containing protein [FCB group bacterium]
MKPFLTIRKKILLLFGLVIILPLVIVAVISYQNSVRTIKRETIEKTVRITREAVEKIHRQLRERKNNLILLRQLLNSPEATKRIGNEDRVISYLQEHASGIFLAYRDFFGKMVFIDPSGKPKFKIRTILTAGGVEKMYTEDRSFQQRDTLFFAASLRANPPDVFASPPLFSEGNYVQRLGVPIDIDGRRVGVLLADVKLTPIFWHANATATLSGMNQMLVFNKLNALFFNSDPFLPRELVIRTAEWLGKHNAPGSRVQYLWLTENKTRKRWILALTKIMPENWSIGVLVPLDFFLVSARRVAYGNALILLSVLFLAGLVIFFMTGKISRSIQKVTEGAAEISKGNLDTKIEVNTNDEVRVLADAFNKMTDNLKEKLEEIRRITLEVAQKELDMQSDRQHIAREMHDNIGTKLTSVLYKAELVKRYLEPDKTRAEQLLALLAEDTREAIDEVRQVIWAVDKVDISWSDFCAFLKQWGTSFFQSEERISFRFSCSGDENVIIEPKIKLNLLRIFQEACTNILKYAQARTVSATLTLKEGVIRVEIKDDGIGFEIGNWNREKINHRGLKNMEDRARELGGRFVIHTGPDTGTRINVEIPVD